MKRLCSCFIVLIAAIAASTCTTSAMGTVLVRQHDGSSKTYKSVTVKMNLENLGVTSNDGAGLLVVGKASCTHIGALVRCLPYDAVLTQYGSLYHIAVKTGTLWLNPTRAKQTLPSSSTQLQPQGVLLKMQTKAGTSVSLTGTVDEMQK